jgi:hypothetical protein
MHHLYGTAEDPIGLRGLDPDARQARLRDLLAPLIDTLRQRTDAFAAAVHVAADDDTLDDSHHWLKRAVNDIFDTLYTQVIDYAAARERNRALRAASALLAPQAPKPASKTSIDDLLTGDW